MRDGSERAAEHLRNRLHLQNLAQDLNEWHIEHTGENFTGVAASIVPERDNLDELIDLVGECLQYGIFPLIGELEHAGHSSGDYYERHKLHDHELRTVILLCALSIYCDIITIKIWSPFSVQGGDARIIVLHPHHHP